MTLLGLSIVNQECLTQGFMHGFLSILNRLSVIVYEVVRFFFNWQELSCSVDVRHLDPKKVEY